MSTTRSWAKLLALSLAVLLLLTAGGFLLISKLRYGREAVITTITKRTGASAQFGTFKRTWFPPGFQATNLRLKDSAGDVLTLAHLDAIASYAGLLHPKTLRSLRATGLRLVVRGMHLPFNSGDKSNSGIAIDRLDLSDASIELAPTQPNDEAVIIPIQALTLKHLSADTPTEFHVSLRNPKPLGDVVADGHFGPVGANPEQTPVSGTFTFNHAELSIFKGISGLLHASGKFEGPFGQLRCTGTADVPQFQVRGSSHAVPLNTQFITVVNGMNGDVVLDQVTSHFNGTTVTAVGKVAGGEHTQSGKTFTADLQIRTGRVEDLLLLFSQSRLPAMKGAVLFHGTFSLPPGPPDFLTRLRMRGGFEIVHGRFTNTNAQTPLNRLSDSAKGESKQQIDEDPTTATAEIRSSVLSRDGVAHLSDTVFEAPGIHASLHGTFTLHGKDIDMGGTLETAGKLPDATTGVKSLFLKIAQPMWHKKASVRSIPFHIGGKASHPILSLALHG